MSIIKTLKSNFMEKFIDLKIKTVFMVLFCFMTLFGVVGCGITENMSDSEIQAAATNKETFNKDGVLRVNYIDVGQADSILIQSPNGRNMLIDAGETKDKAVIDYLNSRNVKKLDVIVATHPHEDHISEMAEVVKNFDVGEFYMPKKQHTTKTFEKMVDAVLSKNITVNEAKAGISINFDENIKCDIIAPCGSDYDNLNNWSAVIKLSYGNTSFIFTGDAEDISEKEIIGSGVDIKADVLKVGHHGSHSSTTKSFLEKIAPKYAVISAAKVNDYGHPHKETISLLNDFGVKIFGTYDCGNIVAVSNGQDIEFNIGSEAEKDKAEDKNTPDLDDVPKLNQQYIGNKNSKKFHLSDCLSLPSEKNRVLFNSRQEALEQGYSACSKCNP